MDLQPDQPDKLQGMQDLSDKYSPGELSSVEGQPAKKKLERYGKTAATTQLIPEKYQNVLKELCRKIAIQDQFARIEEVKKAAEQRFYWRGMFDVCWNEQQNTWEQPSALYGLGNSSEADTGDISLHYPLNIYQSFGRGHITVVSEPWKIRMEAKKVDAPNALRVSSAADTMREKIEAQNSIKDLRMDAARLSWTDGRTSFYSRWITDGARFGYEDEAHDEESEEGIGEGGTPPEKKPRQPKGGEVLDAYGVLECKVPITAQRTAKKDFRQLAYEIGMGAAKSMFPWIAKGLQGGSPGPGEYEFDRTTRIAVTQGLRMLQQTGDTVAQLATWERDWIRPSFFTEIDNETDRKWMEDNYPDGCLVEWIGQTYCRSRNESMDDHWEDVHPLPGDGQSTPSCGYLLMSVQDALNDLTDLKMERAMKSIPAIWCNKNAGINLQAISKEKAGPGAHYGIELENGMIAQDQFFAEPAPQAPADEDAMWQAIMGDIPQALTGLYPAAIGESDPSNSTLGGIKLLQAASKGQSGLAWSSFREGYAKSMMQLIRIGAYYRAADTDEEGMVRIDDRLVDLEDLRDGNWACTPDGDESYPNTHAEKKEALNEMLAIFGPQLITSSPKNMALAKDVMGLEDFEVPDADTEEDQMQAINQMLEEPPIPLPALKQYELAVQGAQPTGQPAPPQPPDEALYESSMPIDPEVDDAKASYTVLQNWLRSGTGKQAKNDKPDGYKNIRLRMIAYKAQMQKDQQAQQQQQLQTFAQTEQAKELAKAPKPAKSPSETINFADLGPSGKLQVGKQAGLDLSADVGADLAATHMAAGKQPPPSQQVPPNAPSVQ